MRTTEIQMGDRHEAIATLNQLIEVCEDAHKLYASASEDTPNPHLRELFVWHSRQRDRFVTELQGLVRWLGGTPVARGSTTGTFLRGYLDVKSALAGTDGAVIDECERAESRLIKAYESALSHPFAWEIHDPIRQEFEIVSAAHDHLRHLREISA